MVATELKSELRVVHPRSFHSFLFFTEGQTQLLQSVGFLPKNWEHRFRLPIDNDGFPVNHPDAFMNVLVQGGNSLNGEMVLEQEASEYYRNMRKQSGNSQASKVKLQFSLQLYLGAKPSLPQIIEAELRFKHQTLEEKGFSPHQTMILKHSNYAYPAPTASPHEQLQRELNRDLVSLAHQFGRNIILFTDSSSFLSGFARVYPEAPQGMEKEVLVNHDTEGFNRRFFCVGYKHIT